MKILGKTVAASTLLIIAGVCTFLVAVAVAAVWYYSNTQSTTVTTYIVGLNAIPANVAQGTILTFTGTVTFNANPVPDTTVTLFLNDATTGLTAITNAAGTYSISYTVTQTTGTLNFKTGIEK